MSFKFLQNQQPASFAEAMYQWMQFMTNAPTDPTPGAGWVCVASGDGSSYGINVYPGMGLITSSSNFNTNKSWIVIRQPNTTRQFCFQVGSTAAQWRIKYSFSGFSSGGSPTQAPSALDQQVLLGGGTDAAPTMSPFFNNLTAGSFVSSFGADTDGYSFFSFSYPKGDLRNVDSIKNLMLFDDLKMGHYNATDLDPAVMYIGATFGSNNALQLTKSSDHSSGALKFDGYVANQKFNKISIASWGVPNHNWGASLPDSSINSWCPSPNQELNPHNGFEDLCPVSYFYKNMYYPDTLDPYQCYKGTSSNFFMGSMQRNNGDFYNFDDLSGESTQGRKIYITGFALPWNNQTPTP